MIVSFKEWFNIREGTKATIYTQSSSKGATVHNSQQDELPVILNIDDIINYEPAEKMKQLDSQENMQDIIKTIKSGQSLPPILVRKVNNLRGISKPRWDGKILTNVGGVSNSHYKYQVIDGHHRYWAYKAAGIKQIPAIIIANNNIRREKTWTQGKHEEKY